MALDLHNLYIFVQVIDQGGFASAARALNVPKSTLSRRIVSLEDSLGVRLINRSSRVFAITDAGRELYERAADAVVAAESVERLLRHRLGDPGGIVRFNCMPSIAQPALSRLLPEYAQQFPRVHLIQHIDDRCTDLRDESVDLFIRTDEGSVAESHLIRRPLAICPFWLVTSPEYLRHVPEPRRPEDLADCDAIVLRDTADKTCWQLTHEDGRKHVVEPVSRLHSNDVSTLVSAAQTGVGIASLPADICASHIESGALERVLPQWTSGVHLISALIPPGRHLFPAVRSFVDFMTARLPSAMRSISSL